MGRKGSIKNRKKIGRTGSIKNRKKNGQDRKPLEQEEKRARQEGF